MSTYYAFYCKKANLLGGFFSRQAWGAGNADLIENFKFVWYCISNYGVDSVAVVDEHSEEWCKAIDINSPNSPEEYEARAKFLVETVKCFPHSGDWTFMKDKHEDFCESWFNKEKNKLFADIDEMYKTPEVKEKVLNIFNEKNN